ncbi:methylenetetrahydrofolate reductase [Anaeramoeba flamelloides]|uniref:Methylenetetrahydrofolate reductase n=1 Tax=Anaeramoeba flamelloides TaxID=1746091 RepID=A0AAV7ZU81_9EUKA|nr:methylenetetrahydrofolate reductase [Anaeramoeba flamelloides]KAJ6242997.1 methylenetetrahydrofolate reductase [Anaeramoeba flamelloides]
MRIIELIAKHQSNNQLLENSQPFFSFEFVGPTNNKQQAKLLKSIKTLSTLEPLCIDFASSTLTAPEELFLISYQTQMLYGLETVYQLSWPNTTKKEIVSVLKRIKKSGIQNIVIRNRVLSEKEKYSEKYFQNESQVIQFIKEQYNDYFCIIIEGDINFYQDESDFLSLKKTVNFGADLLRTLPFFDIHRFLTFRENCRKYGINFPIIPMILPIIDYTSTTQLIEYNNIIIPEEILIKLSKLKNEPEPLLEYGVKITTNLCKTLIKHRVRGFHFLTLNREEPIKQILQGLNLILSSRLRRQLPYRKSTDPKRKNEIVRPIFWAKRPISYTLLTSHWEKFPKYSWIEIKNGKPEYGQLNEKILKEIHKCKSSIKDFGLKLRSIRDVEIVFMKYLQGKIRSLPWKEDLLSLENMIIKTKLEEITQNGLLIINSQPRINSVSSEDLRVGFGGPGGYIFQKRYLEFFIDPERITSLIKYLETNSNLIYHATNHDGSTVFTNNKKNHITTVTWGIFSGEIIQPTVVDPYSFLSVWRKEAFALWLSQWGDHYQKESKSRKIIETIHNNYFLMNIVDNFFIQTSHPLTGSLWTVLTDFFRENPRKDIQN